MFSLLLWDILHTIRSFVGNIRELGLHIPHKWVHRIDSWVGCMFSEAKWAGDRWVLRFRDHS